MNTFPSLVCLFHCTGIVIVMFIITVFAIVANDDTETVVFTAFIRRSYYRCLELKIRFFFNSTSAQWSGNSPGQRYGRAMIPYVDKLRIYCTRKLLSKTTSQVIKRIIKMMEGDYHHWALVQLLQR